MLEERYKRWIESLACSMQHIRYYGLIWHEYLREVKRQVRNNRDARRYYQEVINAIERDRTQITGASQ